MTIGKEGMEELIELPLRGTELSEAAEEFWDSQKRRIAFQLKIISTSKVILERKLSEDREVGKVIQEFKDGLKKKVSFTKAYREATEKLREIGKIEQADVYFKLHLMVKQRKFEKLVDMIKPTIQELGRWSSWREERFKRHKEDEEEMLQRITRDVEDWPIWNNWLKQVKGIGYALAAQVVGGFESALDPEETLATHFRSPSQMWAFAGLDVDERTGKAPKRKRGQKLTFKIQLRSVLLGRIFPSFLRQDPKDSGYRRIYDQEKARLYRRFGREGLKIVPSSKLPDREGGKYEPEGVISEGHIHNMARRKTIKIFVSHLWEELRKAKGLPAGLPYIIEVRGHPEESYIPPVRDVK